eukprot:2702001-Rhodomonas_salina.1
MAYGGTVLEWTAVLCYAYNITVLRRRESATVPWHTAVQRGVVMRGVAGTRRGTCIRTWRMCVARTCSISCAAGP